MHYFTFILSLLNPIYALVFSINENIKRSNYSNLPIYSFALAFAAIGFCVVPEGLDLSRHYERIESLNGLTYQAILDKNRISYLLFDSYAWLLNQFGLPKEAFTASVVFFGYVLVFLIFKDVKKNFLYNVSSVNIALAFLIFWLSIDFIFLSSGLRNMFANIIVFYAAYHGIYYHRFKKFLLYSVIAFLIHPAALIPIALTTFSIKLPHLSRVGKALVITGILLIVGSKILYTAAAYLASLFSNFSFYSAAYFDENNKWGLGAASARNLTGIISGFIITRLPGYIAILYLLIKKPKVKDPLYLLLCVCVFSLGLFFLYFTIYQRLNDFFVHIFSLYIIIEYAKDKSKFNKYFMLAFLVSLILYSLINIQQYLSYLLSSKEVLYKPLLFIFFSIS